MYYRQGLLLNLHLAGNPHEKSHSSYPQFESSTPLPPAYKGTSGCSRELRDDSEVDLSREQ